MAAPAVPTVNSLVREGLRQARIFNPNATQIATYQNEVMEQLKNELWQELKQSKPLMTFSYMALTAGQSRYSCPSDFSSDMTMVVLTGLVTANVISASANTLYGATAQQLGIDQAIGKDICIISGTGVSSVSQIINVQPGGIAGSTIFTVYPDFQSTPDATSIFMVVDNQWPVESKHIAEYDKFRTAGLDRPRYFFPMGDEDFDEFIFDVPPDNRNNYVIRMRYTVNIMTLDLNSTLMSTLYQKFREYWIRGVKYQALSDNDDTTAPQSEEERKQKLQGLIRSQQYGTDLRNLQQHVEDYA